MSKNVKTITRKPLQTKAIENKPVLFIATDDGRSDHQYYSGYDVGENVMSAILIGGVQVASFYFQIEEMPSSCSILDIGDFDLNQPASIDKVPKEMVEDMVNLTLNKLLSLYQSNGKSKSCKTVVFTLIKEQSQLKNIIDKNPNFTLVKEFVNSGSNNLNYFYVSNN